MVHLGFKVLFDSFFPLNFCINFIEFLYCISCIYANISSSALILHFWVIIPSCQFPNRSLCIQILPPLIHLRYHWQSIYSSIKITPRLEGPGPILQSQLNNGGPTRKQSHQYLLYGPSFTITCGHVLSLPVYPIFTFSSLATGSDIVEYNFRLKPLNAILISVFSLPFLSSPASRHQQMARTTAQVLELYSPASLTDRAGQWYISCQEMPYFCSSRSRFWDKDSSTDCLEKILGSPGSGERKQKSRAGGKTRVGC